MGTATCASIGQTTDVIGTIEPVSNANAAFQVAGKVTSVAVTVGQGVTAGQTLANVDPTSLNESVSSAQSTVASDEAKLTSDEDSEDAEFHHRQVDRLDHDDDDHAQQGRWGYRRQWHRNGRQWHLELFNRHLSGPTGPDRRPGEGLFGPATGSR